MADTPLVAYSPLQGLASMTGAPMGGNTSPAPAAGANPNPSGISNMVAALIRKMRGDPASAGLGGYEGNVASEANPFNSGVYGMPSTPQPPAQPAAPPPGQQPMPPNPFTQGAQPTPFLNGSALFGQPPTT